MPSWGSVAVAGLIESLVIPSLRESCQRRRYARRSRDLVDRGSMPTPNRGDVPGLSLSKVAHHRVAAG